MPRTTKSFNTRRRLAFCVIIGLTLGSGLVYGYLDGRWIGADELKTAGNRLSELPAKCGNWRLTNTSILADNAAKLLRCHGSIIREYQNSQTGEVVNVAVLFGPRGPIAVHTPEVCYSSVGMRQSGRARKQTVNTEANHHRLWKVRFNAREGTQPPFQVWYALSEGEQWEARSYPRFWLAKHLYKIQVAGPVEREGTDPCHDFLLQLLPQLEPLLHPNRMHMTGDTQS